MTTPVMIRSHTGAMVQARVGMHAKYDRPDARPFIISRFTTDGAAVSECNLLCDLSLDGCTMLHCPFQVGDEVEVLRIHFKCDELDKWVKATIRSHKQAERYRNGGNGIRHASPDLRDAPGYKLEAERF